LKNENRKFVCKDVKLRVENSNTKFTNFCKTGDLLTIPVAHGEGNYHCDDDTLQRLRKNNQIVFKYSDDRGFTDKEANPNGSVENIAGIINQQGNVLGMMPHPERNADTMVGNADGLNILQSIFTSFGKN
jgi:phosphoribosylformylglycinamidine synthase